MAHNVQMIKNNPNWSGKVRIIGISIDQRESDLIKHVNSKGWASVEHYHKTAHSGKKDPMSQYEVQGVPHVLLVDKNGTVVFKGHPAARPDLEYDINKLVNGEELEEKKK